MWKTIHSEIGVPDAKRLRELETENKNLKNLLAQTMLEKVALRGNAHHKEVKPVVTRQVVQF